MQQSFLYDSHELFAGIEFIETQFCPTYPMTLKASLCMPVKKYPLVSSGLVQEANVVSKWLFEKPSDCNYAADLKKVIMVVFRRRQSVH